MEIILGIFFFGLCMAKPIDQWAMAKPMDITFHRIHGFCHGTMGNAITWQNPYTMTFANVYDFCHA